jgi:hypothetical protein
MPATEFPPDVAALLGRLRDRLAASRLDHPLPRLDS